MINLLTTMTLLAGVAFAEAPPMPNCAAPSAPRMIGRVWRCCTTARCGEEPPADGPEPRAAAALAANSQFPPAPLCGRPTVATVIGGAWHCCLDAVCGKPPRLVKRYEGDGPVRNPRGSETNTSVAAR